MIDSSDIIADLTIYNIWAFNYEHWQVTHIWLAFKLADISLIFTLPTKMNKGVQNSFSKAMQVSDLHFVGCALIPSKHLSVKNQQQKH